MGRSRSRSRSRDRGRDKHSSRRDRSRDRDSYSRKSRNEIDDDRRRPRGGGDHRDQPRPLATRVKSEPESDAEGRRGRDHGGRRRPEDGGGGGGRHRREDKQQSWGGGRGRENRAEVATGANRVQAGDKDEAAAEEPEEEKQKVDMGLSGNLMQDTNVFNGVVVKYSEPPEAKKPKKRWRFYVFKGEESLPVLHLHRQSAYLIGKDRKVADIPVDHPSCSRQHAAFQYRAMERTLADGRRVNRTIPYIIDLESSNGTYVNNQKIEAKRYVELKEQDVLKFGYSSREYVLLHENSGGDDD